MFCSVWDVRAPQGFFSLTLADQKPLLLEIPSFMSILNATPDSFSDDHIPLEFKIESSLLAVQQGAKFIDVGGESTRPGASPVNEQEEIDRVIPVLQLLKVQCKKRKLSPLISIDTTKVAVAKAAVHAGVHIINDISGGDFSNLEMIRFAAKHKIPIILNHCWGNPESFYQHDLSSQNDLPSKNLLQTMRTSLQKKVTLYTSLGGSLDAILLDPGIGFGKNFDQNMQILTHLNELAFAQRPIVIGISHKRVVQDLLNRPLINDRLAGSMGLQLASICKGASIIRTHNPVLMIDLCKAFVSGLGSC